MRFIAGANVWGEKKKEKNVSKKSGNGYQQTSCADAAAHLSRRSLSCHYVRKANSPQSKLGMFHILR
jgi:hypothetical protein